MPVDTLYEYDWTNPESLSMPLWTDVEFNIAEAPDQDGYWRDACNNKRWKADGECNVLYPKYAFMENTNKRMNWADAVIHSPTARGGVYYVSDDGQATLTWDEQAFIWYLDGAWTGDADHGSVDINVRMYLSIFPLPDHVYQTPYTPTGDYVGVWIDKGRNIPALDGATVSGDGLT